MTKDEALRQFAEQGRITNTGDEREKALEAFAKEGRIAPKQPDLWALQPESTGVPSVPVPATPAKTLSPSNPPLFKPGEERPVGWDAMTGNIPDNPDLTTEQDMWHSFIAGGKGGIGNVVSGLGYFGTKLRGQKLKDWAYNTADEWARSAAESQMKVQNPESLLNRVVSGIGSSLPMMVPSLLASLAAAPAGGALGAGLVGMGVRGLMGSSEAAGNAGEVYRDMIAQGLSPELAEQGADRSFMTELPLNILTEHLGVFGNMGSKVIKSPIARSIAGEALQEGAQETYQALIPEAAKGSAGKGLMDYAGNLAKQVPNAPEAFMNEGVPAMISGALMGGGAQLAANIQARQTPGTVTPAPSHTPVGLPPVGGVTQGADRNALTPQSYQFNGGEVGKPVPVAPIETPKPVVAKGTAAIPGMVTPQEQKPLTTNPKTLSEIMEQTGRAYANAASQLSNVIGGPKAPKAPTVQPTVQPPIQPKREPKGILGKEEEITTPDGRIKVGTQFVVVPADSLVPSYTVDMEVNPDYPQELQPRNRERAASLARINDIVNNLDPERLGESQLSSEGAPIVGSEDGVVESGNGRTIAIQRAYRDGNPGAKKYKEWLIQNAERFGLSSKAVQDTEAPVLIRVRMGQMTPQQRQAFAALSNKTKAADAESALGIQKKLEFETPAATTESEVNPETTTFSEKAPVLPNELRGAKLNVQTQKEGHGNLGRESEIATSIADDGEALKYALGALVSKSGKSQARVRDIKQAMEKQGWDKARTEKALWELQAKNDITLSTDYLGHPTPEDYKEALDSGLRDRPYLDVGFWDDKEGRKQYSPKGNDYMIIGKKGATALDTQNIPREDQIVLNDEREATGVNSLFEADDFDAQDKGEFGPVYRGYEGESAVAKLMKEKQGEVISAMRDPRLGDNSSIDFVWGIPGDPQKNYKGGYGFAHIKAKHGIEAAELVPKIIREGKIELQDDKDLAIYQSADGVVALRRTWDDKAKNWVLTSYLPNTMKDPRPDRTSEIVGQTGESGSSPDRDLSKKTIPHPAEIDNADKTLDSTADPYGKNDGEIEIADPENKSLVRVKDIFTAMRKIAPVRKGIATRKKGVVGVAKKDSHVARTRYWNDIPTALHETGHILDYKMGLREDIPMPMERNAINEELLDLGKRTSGEKVVADYENGDVSSATFQDAEAYLTKEGIAEFFREYALDPTRAEQLAPSYYKRFTETLENHERFASVVKELEKVTRDYYSQSLHDRALAGIHSGGEKEKLSLKETAQKAWDKFLFEIDDRTIYLKKIQDMVKDYAMKFAPEMMQGKYLKDKFAFHTLLRTTPGFMGKAKSDIKAMLEPLKKMGAERYEDLQVYLKLRGALDYWDNDMEPGIGMNRSEAESEINRIAAAYPIIPEAAEKVRTAYNSMVEKTMVDSGIWSMDELTQWREKFKNYVPFMRVNDDGSVRLPPTKGKSGSTFIDLGKGTAQRKGLGGENAFMGTQDPVEAMLKNVLIFNRLAEKNRIGQALVASAEAAPTEFSWLAEPITTNEKSGGSTFHVWRDGKKQLFATDPDILEALTGMDQAFSNNILLQTAAKFSNTLKLGATRMNPAFWMVNLARDAAYASLVSDSMAPPLWNTAKGLVALASKDAETQELVKKAFDSGVGYSGITELGLNMSNKKVSQAIRRQIGDEKFWKKFTGAWDASVGEMNERIEMAPKITEFINLVKKGVPERQAAMMAREVNLDFSRGGRTGKAVNQVTAFSNPAVQGTSKLARTAFSKETAGKFWLKTGLFVVLPSIISWALNKDDDEYKRLSRDLKDRYWMFKAGDKWIRIPKPELAGLCGSFTERLLDDLNKKDPDAFRGFGRAVFEAAAPSLLPTILTPILEHKMEKSFFFDNDIIPKKLQGLPPEMQYTRDTSSIARFLGKAWGVSPMIVDNYIKGYTGGAGEALSKLPDTIMDITGTSGNVPREAKRFSEYLLINRFTADPLRNSESIKRFYDLKEQTATERAGFEAKIRAGERLKMPYDAAMAKSFAKTGESLSELRKTIASIQRSKNIGPEEKRKRIDRLNLQMNQLAERMLDRYYKGRDRR